MLSFVNLSKLPQAQTGSSNSDNPLGVIPKSVLYISFRPNILNLSSFPNTMPTAIQTVLPLTQTRSLGSYVPMGRSVSKPVSMPGRVHMAELVLQVEE